MINVNDTENGNPSYPLNPQYPHMSNSWDLNNPTLGEAVYENIPDTLKVICKPFKNEREKDIILLGAVTTFSSFMNNYVGVYDNNKVYANLFMFVVAPPASGKGVLKNLRYLAEPIHNFYKEMPAKEGSNDSTTANRLFILPANNSSTGIYQLLYENFGIGFMLETEGDTLTNSFKQDFGDFSSGLRNAFHHEPISYNRRAKNERVEISCPRLSVILSGTENQVKSLIPSTENGLFSRFIFYRFNSSTEFKDVFEKTVDTDLKEHFLGIGDKHFQFWSEPCEEEIEFQLTISQKKKYKDYFSTITNSTSSLLTESNMIASVFRLGLVFYRIAMVLTYLRIYEGSTKEFICSDTDFEITKSIIDVLYEHMLSTLELLPKASSEKLPTKNEQVIINLQEKFSRQDYLLEANNLGIPAKTIDGYISRLIDKGSLRRESHGFFCKISS